MYKDHLFNNKLVLCDYEHHSSLISCVIIVREPTFASHYWWLVLNYYCLIV